LRERVKFNKKVAQRCGCWALGPGVGGLLALLLLVRDYLKKGRAV